jgi:hypothetical protein
MPPESGLQDGSARLARVSVPGGTPEERRQRIETLIADRLAAFREKLARVRIVTVAFSGYRPMGANIDLGDVPFDMEAGRELSAAGSIAQRYPQFVRLLSDAEMSQRMAEAEAALRWRFFHE